MGKIILKNAVKRKKNWLYYIDSNGNLCGTQMKRKRSKKKSIKKTSKKSKRSKR